MRQHSQAGSGRGEFAVHRCTTSRIPQTHLRRMRPLSGAFSAVMVGGAVRRRHH